MSYEDAVIRPLVGGPLDGQQAAVEPDEQVFRYEVPDEDLERLLEASVAVAQGKLVPMPTRTAVYRLRRLGEGNVIPIERYVFEFEEWA